MTIHVGCAVEGAYVPHSAAMLLSVLGQSGFHDVQVHYVHGPELPAESKGPLAAMIESEGARVSFVDVPDELCVGLPTEGFTRKATWYRIFLPDLLSDLDRILFLDADLLALDSLEPLWATDVSDHYLAAVTNVLQQDHIFRPAQLGIDPGDYFNAGVLLLNLELMRRDGCTARMRDFAVAEGELFFRDQDALNYVLAERRLELHPRWNAMNSFEVFPWSAYVFGWRAVEEAMKTPGIRHFEGPSVNKPWHRGCHFPHRELYFEHRRRTPWPEVALEGEPVGSGGRARRLVRRIRRRLSA